MVGGSRDNGTLDARQPVSELELAEQSSSRGATTSCNNGNDGDNDYAAHQQPANHNNTMMEEDRDFGSSDTNADHFVGGKSDLFQTLMGTVGNVLEWYDFAVFGFLSDVIGDVFFPAHQKGHMAITESFAVFGGAFLMRPIGGCVMGYIGDKYGRKNALVISIFLMAFPTFALGCLPSYDRVGWVAILLLIIVRLLQGFSVGGQLMSSAVYTLESHRREDWGYYGSLVMAAANFGTLLGGFAGWGLRSNLTEKQLHDFGWRIPFLSGILVSFSGFYLKGHGTDEEPHVATSSSSCAVPPNPIILAFAKNNRRSLLASTMVPMLWSCGFYLSFVWMAIFMNDLISVPVPGAFKVNATALFLSVCLLFPVAGILSDRYGRRNIMGIGGIFMALVSPVMILLIGTGNAALALVAQMVIGVALSFWGAPMIAWLVESFAPEARLTSVAIGYNLAQALLGGLTPMLATVMVDSFGPSSPGLLLTFISTISLVGLWCVAPDPAFHESESIKNSNHPSLQLQIPSKGPQSVIRRRHKQGAAFSVVPAEDAHHEDYEEEFHEHDRIETSKSSSQLQLPSRGPQLRTSILLSCLLVSGCHGFAVGDQGRTRASFSTMRFAASEKDQDETPPLLDAKQLFPDGQVENCTMLPHKPMGITIEESLADNNYVFVSKIIANSNADKAGIQVGDVLLAVTGLFGDLTPVVGLGVEKVKGMVGSRPEEEALELQVVRGTNVMEEHEKAVIEICSLESDDALVDQCISGYVSMDYGEETSPDGEECDPEEDSECLVDNLFEMWAEDLPAPIPPPTADDISPEDSQPAVKPWSSRSSPSGTYVRDPLTGEMKNID